MNTRVILEIVNGAPHRPVDWSEHDDRTLINTRAVSRAWVDNVAHALGRGQEDVCARGQEIDELCAAYCLAHGGYPHCIRLDLYDKAHPDTWARAENERRRKTLALYVNFGTYNGRLMLPPAHVARQRADADPQFQPRDTSGASGIVYVGSLANVERCRRYVNPDHVPPSSRELAARRLAEHGPRRMGAAW